MARLWCAEGDVLKMKLEEDLASTLRSLDLILGTVEIHGKVLRRTDITRLVYWKDSLDCIPKDRLEMVVGQQRDGDRGERW